MVFVFKLYNLLCASLFSANACCLCLVHFNNNNNNYDYNEATPSNKYMRFQQFRSPFCVNLPNKLRTDMFTAFHTYSEMDVRTQLYTYDTQSFEYYSTNLLFSTSFVRNIMHNKIYIKFICSPVWFAAWHSFTSIVI